MPFASKKAAATLVKLLSSGEGKKSRKLDTDNLKIIITDGMTRPMTCFAPILSAHGAYTRRFRRTVYP